MVGSLVVRVMLDYRTLPCISSQSPYLESLRPNRQAPAEGIAGRDVEFVVYGWSRAPLCESETSVWALPDAAFGRLVQSREPFWASMVRDGDTFRLYLLSDRYGLYALGYPVIPWIGHLITLADLSLLVMAFGASPSRRPRCSTPSRPRAGRGRRAVPQDQLLPAAAFLVGAKVLVAILAVRDLRRPSMVAGAEFARSRYTAQRLVEVTPRAAARHRRRRLDRRSIMVLVRQRSART